MERVKPAPAVLTNVSFLLTDIERSVRGWEQDEVAMAAAVEAHEALVEAAVVARGGRVVKSKGEGDSTFNVFDDPVAAVTAALDLQRAITTYSWPTANELRVRAAVHHGRVQVRGDDFFGPTVNRAARLKGLAHGSQVLVSSVVASAVEERPIPGVTLRDLGSHKLRDLRTEERVFQLVHPSLPAEFPPLVSVRTPTLPTTLTTLIGRDDDRKVLGAAITTNRLVTLAGPGGVGKTRLALSVADDLRAEFPHGVWFVDLTPAEPTTVNDIAAKALDAVSTGDDKAAAIASVIEGAPALVVFDNCEHVIDAVAQLVISLLRSADVSVMTTSREPLGVPGEIVRRVDPLPYDDGEAPATRLFLERCRDASPELVLTDEDFDVAQRIVERLDGLPLAIEIAAAATPSLGLKEVESALAQVGALPVRRGGPEHHRTMDATVQWSYDLLDDRGRACLRRLAPFMGGFPLEGAVEVCGFAPLDPAAVAPVLADLVRRSLVTVHHGEVTRFALLETIRSFARARAQVDGEFEEIRRRHLRWVRRLAVSAGMRLRQGWSPEVAQLLDRESANIVAAVSGATSPADHADATVVWASLWMWSGMLQLPDDSLQHHVERASAVDAEAVIAVVSNRMTAAALSADASGRSEVFESGLVALPDAERTSPAIALDILSELSRIGNQLKRHEEVVTFCDRGVDLADAIGDRLFPTILLLNKAHALESLGQGKEASAAREAFLTRAQRAIASGVYVHPDGIRDVAENTSSVGFGTTLLMEAAAEARRRGDAGDALEVLIDLGAWLCDRGYVERAALALGEAADFNESSWPWFAPGLNLAQARLGALGGRHVEAAAFLDEAERVVDSPRQRARVAIVRCRLALQLHDREAARASLDLATRVLGDSARDEPLQADLALVEAELALGELDIERAERVLATIASSELGAVRRCRWLLARAELLRFQQDHSASRRSAREAVEAAVAVDAPGPAADGLEILAMAYASAGPDCDPSLAAELVGEVRATRAELGIRLPIRAELDVLRPVFRSESLNEEDRLKRILDVAVAAGELR